MAILKYANQSGVVYAYEASYEWDPVRKQSRSKRKCIGRVDPETDEIIPCSGKRGRPPKKGQGSEEKEGKPEESLKEKNAELLSRLSEAEKRNSTLQEENRKLLKENRALKGYLEKMVQGANSLLGTPPHE